MKQAITNCYGRIIKEENLWCLRESGLPNTCILESRDAFPGYYGEVPHNARPLFVYLMCDQAFDLEFLTRSFMKINRFSGIDFNAAPARVSMNGKNCAAIRISGLSGYDQILPVQEAFGTEGFHFKKQGKPIEDEAALISIDKFFTLEYLDDSGIYLDLLQKDFGYFPIPELPSWETFKTRIKCIRNNWTGGRFDAALGYFYGQNGITDLVRIYTGKETESIVRELKSVYL